MNNVAMILGGGPFQLGIIKRALQLGLRTLVTDISKDAPGKDVADLFYQIDTNDRYGLLDIAREHQVTMIVSDQTDRVVPTIAFLNERLGLNGIRPGIAHRFTNKFVMLNELSALDIKIPRYAEVSSLSEVNKIGKEWGYPLLLKPKESQAAIGVVKIEDEKHLDDKFAYSMGISRDGKILVEEFIDGLEVSVEGFSIEGDCHILAIGEKEHYPFNDCITKRIAYPPHLSQKVVKIIENTAKKVVETLGLDHGLSHGEYILRDGSPYFIEVAARGGGHNIASVIVPHVSGVDVYQLLIKRLMGHKVRMPDKKSCSAILEWFDFEEGKVKSISGIEKIIDENLVFDIKLNFKEGDILRTPRDGTSRLGYLFSLGETRAEVESKVFRVKELVHIEYE